jgi:signal peptidase I
MFDITLDKKINIQFFATSDDSDNKNDTLDEQMNSEKADNDMAFSNDENSPHLEEINFETGEVITTVEKKSVYQIILTNFFDILEVFAYSIALMVVTFLFVIKFVTVDGWSMNSTLIDKDRLIICNLFYTPETDDVIVLNYEPRDELLVKRVIGVEGDTVKIDFDTWEVWVNGEYLEQPYLKTNPEVGNEPMEKGLLRDVDENNCVTFTVEEGKVFVMGDNRNHSSDSRVFGQLDADEILGKVIFRVYPFESVGAIK